MSGILLLSFEVGGKEAEFDDRQPGKRVTVAHSLARIGQVQGTEARYFGERKQLFDTRRAACVVNLQIIDRLPNSAAGATGYHIP